MKYLFLLPALLVITTVNGQWTPNTAVNLEIAALNTSDLQVAATSDGKTWIAYYHNTGSNYDMRAQLLDVNGNKLLGPNGVIACSQPSGSATFVFNVCTDLFNNLIIGFQYQVAGVNTAAVTKVTTTGTLPWSSNGITLTAGLSPYVAVLSSGETVVAWNNNSPATLYMQKLNDAGAAVWNSPVSLLVGTTNTTRGQIIPNPGGNFTLVFQQRGVGINTTLYAQRYNNAGTAQWPAPVQLSSLATAGTRYYSVLAENDTTYAGYYAASGNRFRSYVQRINPDGVLPWGLNGSLFSDYATGTEPYQQTTNIAKAPGSPYVWAVSTYSNTLQSQYGVYVQKFNRTTGARLLNVFGKEIFPISTDLYTQAGTLNLVSDGPLFMYYNKDYKMYATLLNGNGDFVWSGSSVELSSTTATLAVPKGRFAFRPMINNKAVAVWYENRGTEYRAYAQDVTSSGAAGTLPIKLGPFAAKRNGLAIDLSWTTFSEASNAGFYAERSADGIAFTSFGFVPAKAADGNNATSLFYLLTDTKPLEGINYYRLRQVDADGKTQYSPVVSITPLKGKNNILVYPNPVADVLTIHLALDEAKGSIGIYNEQGQLLKSENLAGKTQVKMNVKALAQGRYFIRLTHNGETVTQSFIKK